MAKEGMTKTNMRPQTRGDWMRSLRNPAKFRERATLRLFFWLTNAPDQPYMLTFVVNNVIAILRTAASIWVPEAEAADSFPSDKIQSLIHRLEQLHTVLSEVQLLGSNSEKEGRRELEEHALYAALFSKYKASATTDGSKEERSPASVYQLLQAHLLISAALTELRRQSLKDYERDDPKLEKRLSREQYRPSLIVRQLRMSSEWRNRLRDELQPWIPPMRFAGQDTPQLSTDRDRSEDWYQTRAGYIISYAKQAHGIRERIKRIVSPHGKHSSPSVILPRDPDDDFLTFGNLELHGAGAGGGGGRRRGAEPPDDLVPPLVFTVSLDDETETEQEALENDHCPDEFEDKAIISWSVGEIAFARSPGSYEGFSAAQINHLIKSTKVFPFACDHLAPEELLLIEHDFRKELEARLPSVACAEELTKLEPKLLALVMLWTSRSLESVIELVEIGDEDDNPAAEMACVRASDYRIRVTVPFPSYATEQDRVPRQERELTAFFLMPDSAELGALLTEYRSKQAKYDSETGPRRKFFRRETAEYIEDLKGLLADPEHQRRRSERLTLAKIASALYVRTFNATGKDITATTIITGTETHLSRVPMFYVCRSHETIERIYHDVVSEFRAEIRAAATQLRTMR